ncbi:MAG TPA: hypothetical protein VGI06_00315 [Acidimicrobiales bacterium]
MARNRTTRRRWRRLLMLGGLVAGLAGYRQYRLANAPDPARDLGPPPR